MSDRPTGWERLTATREVRTVAEEAGLGAVGQVTRGMVAIGGGLSITACKLSRSGLGITTLSKG